MSILTLKGLGLTLGDPLFTDLDLTLNAGDRMGLVASNGRGKTSLLTCLSGQQEPTSGDITRARGLRIGYVAQYVPQEALSKTLYDVVLAALPPDQADYEAWRVDVVLADLDVPYDLHHRPLSELSGGWQRTAMLAATWVQEPDLLLLDEPTNHLDLGRLARLETWLSALPRQTAVILTSHDRAFLDAMTNRTLFLRTEGSRIFPLPYSKARAALEEADAADARRHANDLNKAQNLRRQAAKLKNIGVNSGSDLLLTKTKQLSDRAERLEAAAKPAHVEASAGAIRLSQSDSHAKALVTLDDLEVRAPDGRLLYRTGRKWISPGDRVVLLGSNGTGKTQLVTLVAAAARGQESPVSVAASLRLGFSDQHLSHIPNAATPFDLVTRAHDSGDARTRAFLAGAGIRFALQNGPIEALSGGQKARLAMLLLRLKTPNLYLLDEPTNHLDIAGQEELEQELNAQGAACLLVSHDRHFLKSVGQRFWWIRGKRLEEVESPDAFLAEEMACAD